MRQYWVSLVYTKNYSTEVISFSLRHSKYSQNRSKLNRGLDSLSQNRNSSVTSDSKRELMGF